MARLEDVWDARRRDGREEFRAALRRQEDRREVDTERQKPSSDAPTQAPVERRRDPRMTPPQESSG